MPDPDADILHERARESASEQRRALVSLSTGGVAVFVLALTAENKPALSVFQQIAVSLSLLLLSGAVLSGLLAWRFDAQRNYFWALAIQSTNPVLKEQNDALKRAYYAGLKRMNGALSVLFALGILAAAVFILCRVFNW